MALQLGALRDALIEGGASPESASRAAEELAGYARPRRDVLLIAGIVTAAFFAGVGIVLLAAHLGGRI